MGADSLNKLCCKSKFYVLRINLSECWKRLMKLTAGSDCLRKLFILNMLLSTLPNFSLTHRFSKKGSLIAEYRNRTVPLHCFNCQLCKMFSDERSPSRRCLRHATELHTVIPLAEQLFSNGKMLLDIVRS